MCFWGCSMLYVRALIIAGLALTVLVFNPGETGEALPPPLPLFSVRDVGLSGGPPGSHDVSAFGATVPGLSCTAADLMTDPAAGLAFPCGPRVPFAPPGPVPDAATAAGADFGLDIFGPFTDELDGISVGETLTLGVLDFDFSVDRAPLNGGVTTAAGLSCGIPPTDVTLQAALSEAQGDIFNTGTLAPVGCNAQVTDEGILGLIAPYFFAPAVPPLDDMDALTEEIVGPGPGCTLTGGATGITTCPAMTIAATPAGVLPFIPPGASTLLAADEASILVPPATPAIPPDIPAFGCGLYAGGTPCLAVHSTFLGLVPAPGGDDIDALCWFDINGNGLPDHPFWTGLGPAGPGDMYVFSLTPTSAQVVGPPFFSPADILANTSFGGPPRVVMPAAGLGLATTDDVDALMCHSDDTDGDAWPDLVDNCPYTANVAQADADTDNLGDACDSEGPSPNVSGLGGADDCGDGVDNDGDGFIDGADSPCDTDGDGIADIADTEGPSPNAAGVLGGDDCADGVDNNANGLIDAAEGVICDVDLDGIPDIADTEGPLGNSNGFPSGADDCFDTLDNDADGVADGLDPGCATPPPVLYSVADLGTLGGPVGTHDITPIPIFIPMSCTPADLLTPPGTGPAGACAVRLPPAPAGPVPDAMTLAFVDLGLDSAGPFSDDLNALSYGESVNTGPIDYDFSVDAAPGNLGSTVGLPACGAAPNVGTQAAASEAQGDIFNTGSAAPAGCNLLVSDESILGLIAPTAGAPLVPPLDELDALTDISPLPPGPCTLSSGVFPTTCPAFSLTATIIGDSLTTGLVAPDAFSGAGVADEGSILVPPGALGSVTEPPCAAGGPACSYVHSTTLGIVPGAPVGGDNIDALCWFDANGNGAPDQPNAWIPGFGDYYIFSLTPLSPSVTGGFYSAADLLTPDPLLPGGPPLVLRTAASLGLLAGDNVDALICRDDDTDVDGAPDLLDNCPATVNTTQANADGDQWGDACDNCPATSTPWQVPLGDGDCDFWTDADEGIIGTDPNDPCANTPAANDEADDRWPPDFDDNKTINIVDVLKLKPVFGGPVAGNERYDLATGGGATINIVDVLKMKPVFNKSCT